MPTDAVERIAEALETNGWLTVLCRWYEFEVPENKLAEGELERIGRAYLQSIARDAVSALTDGSSGHSEAGMTNND